MTKKDKDMQIAAAWATINDPVSTDSQKIAAIVSMLDAERQ